MAGDNKAAWRKAGSRNMLNGRILSLRNSVRLLRSSMKASMVEGERNTYLKLTMDNLVMAEEAIERAARMMEIYIEHNLSQTTEAIRARERRERKYHGQ